MDLKKQLLVLGATLMAIAIIFGAFAAHGLKEILEPSSVESFQTGVKYQIYHALTFLMFGLSNYNFKSKGWFYLMFIGIILFSGSIYAIQFCKINEIYIASKIWFTTPLGGVLLIAAWVSLLFQFLKGK